MVYGMPLYAHKENPDGGKHCRGANLLQDQYERVVIMQTQANIHSIVQQCNICECRGGCLGLQLLDSEEVQHQLSQSKRINRKGEHVFRAGEESDAFFVVRSGSIKSYLVTEDGEE